MMGTPFVMVYRVSPLTYRLGRPRVKVPYFAMVNLIAEKKLCLSWYSRTSPLKTLWPGSTKSWWTGPARSK